MLADADMTVANIARLNIYTTDVDRFVADSDALARLRKGGARYSSTSAVWPGSPIPSSS